MDTAKAAFINKVKFVSVEQFWGLFLFFVCSAVTAAATASIVVVGDDVFYCLYFYEIKAITS